MGFELLDINCDKVELLGIEVCDLYINDDLVFTCVPAGAPLEAPSTISNFAASDTTVNSIRMTFSGASGNPTPTYNLYENGNLAATGISSGYNLGRTGPYTATYYVRATNSEGTSNSNSNNGTSAEVANPPSTITNFVASDDRTDGIQITFSPASGADSYSLWSTTNSEYIAHNVNSGDILDITSCGIVSYKVVAINSDGQTSSNNDDGLKVSSSGTVNYTSTGDKSWVVPDCITSVTVQRIAGGGGGASAVFDNFYNTGAGYAGEQECTTLAVTPGETLSFHVPVGGNGGAQVGQGRTNGSKGTDCSFTRLATLTGGTGGSDNLFQGNGATRSMCKGGTNTDGILAYTVYGGQAGWGNGGDGYQAPQGVTSTGKTGGTGSGGGAIGTNQDNTSAVYTGGKGGSGQVTIIW